MKIFSDKKYLPQGSRHCQMLYPFWGFAPLPQSSPGFRPIFDSPELNGNRLRSYIEQGRSIFELTGLEEAQVAVLPFDWRIIEERTEARMEVSSAHADAVGHAQEMAAVAARAGKPLCVFFSHPNATRKLPLANAFVFRRSLLRSRKLPNEFALPLWVVDDIQQTFDGRLPVRAKSLRPTVSFMGYDPLQSGVAKNKMRSFASSLGAVFRGARRSHPFAVRSRALDLLERSRRLRCEFVRRREWWNGAVGQSSMNDQLVHRSHAEFVSNMIDSDYVVCARGEGNCSYRLYEALCCGRIPIFVNTDCVMPYESWIDWTQYCVWVEARDLPHIAEIVLDFHERLTPVRFRELQSECRELWLRWLSPQGFFANFHRYFAAGAVR